MSMYNLGKTCGPSPHRGFLDRIASVERQLHERLPDSCNLRGHLKQKIRMSQDEWIGTVQTCHTHLLLTFELWGQKLKMLMEENNSNLEMKLFALERQLKEGAKGDQWRLVILRHPGHPSLFLILEFPCFLKLSGCWIYRSAGQTRALDTTRFEHLTDGIRRHRPALQWCKEML